MGSTSSSSSLSDTARWRTTRVFLTSSFPTNSSFVHIRAMKSSPSDVPEGSQSTDDLKDWVPGVVLFHFIFPWERLSQLTSMILCFWIVLNIFKAFEPPTRGLFRKALPWGRAFRSSGLWRIWLCSMDLASQAYGNPGLERCHWLDGWSWWSGLFPLHGSASLWEHHRSKQRGSWDFGIIENSWP